MLLENYESRNICLQEVMTLIEELVNWISISKKLLGIKCIGIRTVSGFLAKVGDISYFTPKKLQKLAGLALFWKAQGRDNNKHTRPKET